MPKKDKALRSKYAMQAKPIGEATHKEIQQALGFARAHAARNNKGYLSEDFASHLMEFLVNQGTLYYNIHWVWEAFCRKDIGDLKHKKGKAKAEALTFKRVSITKVTNAHDQEVNHKAINEALIDPKPAPDQPDRIKELADNFKESERVIMVLHYKWEFTLDEIAEVIGVSRERIRQRLLKIDDRMKWLNATGRLNGVAYTRSGIKSPNTHLSIPDRVRTDTVD